MAHHFAYILHHALRPLCHHSFTQKLAHKSQQRKTDTFPRYHICFRTGSYFIDGDATRHPLVHAREKHLLRIRTHVIANLIANKPLSFDSYCNDTFTILFENPHYTAQENYTMTCKYTLSTMTFYKRAKDMNTKTLVQRYGLKTQDSTDGLLKDIRARIV